MYTILLLGSGGREHAIASSIVKSSKCEKLYVAPGNAGTQQIAQSIILDASDFKQIHTFCEQYHIDWIVVGPEQPLVDGIYDYFKDSGIKVIGPSKAAAMLEGSKSFAKAFMAEFGIPTAAYQAFDASQEQAAFDFIDKQTVPIVLKADGLAAGKGVLILDSKAEAKAAIKEMFDGKFGAASNTIVIEQFLDGIEFSVFAATDGKNYSILPMAKDYKRIGEGDTGLNTGGMGAISPVPFVTDDIRKKVIDKIVNPTLTGIQQRGLDYVGFIFFGLILVGDEPYVIEYNCRMGDPETEVVFPRISSDVVEMFEAMVNGTIDRYTLEMHPDFAATVFAVSGGYPEAYQKGKEMEIPTLDGSQYFHAGTKKIDNTVVTNGGRVITCTALKPTLAAAINTAKQGTDQVQFDGKYYRTDIGNDILNLMK